MSSTQFGSNHIAISTWRGWLVAVASAANELRLNIQVLLAVCSVLSETSHLPQLHRCTTGVNSCY